AAVETRGPEHLDVVSLGRLLTEIVESRGEEGRRIVSDVDPGAAARGDRVWLSRALSNLVDNALFHSPAGSKVEVKIEKDRGELLVTTTNEGTLDEHIEKSLFRRFVTTRRDEGGTGLGLS